MLTFAKNFMENTDPIVMQTVEMKESGMALADRLRHLPELLLQLLFPLIIEYLVRLRFVWSIPLRVLTSHQLSWFLIFECVLNILAELTLYADRRFYDAWWNSGALHQ
jgi:sterol O-acyltransferase